VGIGAAIAGGTAVAGLGGALISSNASQSAASTQASAADAAAQAQLNEFNQTQANVAPWTNVGSNALMSLSADLGLGGPGANLLSANGISGLTFQPTQAQLAATPGYQFDLAQGLQATQNANAAQGKGISGQALQGAAQYATGLANNTLTTQQGIFQQNLANVLNPTQNLSNLGQNSALGVGQQGIQAVGNANALSVGGANASAAGTVGSANALSSGLSSATSAPLNYALYNQLLGGSNNAAGSIPGGGTGTVAGGEGGGSLYGNSV
jgi:hypothetical protein